MEVEELVEDEKAVLMEEVGWVEVRGEVGGGVEVVVEVGGVEVLMEVE